ncbi:hypothetical protein IFM12275_14600 [Nocardia sputorum]|nr:hypothetical protein IFM12275_14600 [Nocardia sputorum]
MAGVKETQAPCPAKHGQCGMPRSKHDRGIPDERFLGFDGPQRCCPRGVRAGGRVAVRMPAHPVALELLAGTGPVAVSSADRVAHA